MGLLDVMDDPRSMGLLSLGLRLMSTPGKFGTALGQAGMGAMGDYQAAVQTAEQRKFREQQMALQQAAEARAAAAEGRAASLAPIQQEAAALQLRAAQQAAEQAAAQQAAEAAFRASIPNPAMAAAGAAMANGRGPTVVNAAAMRPVDPQQQLLYNAMIAKQIKPMEYITATAKDDAPVKLGEGEVLLSGKASGYKPLAQGAPKASDTPTAIREYQFAVNQGYKGTFQQFQLDQKRAGATNVNVNTAQNPFYEGIGKAGVEQFKASQAAAEEAARRIPQNAEIQNILQSGKFYSGAGADWKLGFGKAAQAAGLKFNEDAVKNTELLSVQLAQRTLATIRSSGLGAGQGFSNSDREFLQKAVGGSLTLEPATMNRLIELDTKAAAVAIQKHNQAATKIQSQPAMQAFPFDFTVPMPSVPAGTPGARSMPAPTLRWNPQTNQLEPAGG